MTADEKTLEGENRLACLWAAQLIAADEIRAKLTDEELIRILLRSYDAASDLRTAKPGDVVYLESQAHNIKTHSLREGIVAALTVEQEKAIVTWTEKREDR